MQVSERIGAGGIGIDRFRSFAFELKPHRDQSSNSKFKSVCSEPLRGEDAQSCCYTFGICLRFFRFCDCDFVTYWIEYNMIFNCENWLLVIWIQWLGFCALFYLEPCWWRQTRKSLMVENARESNSLCARTWDTTGLQCRTFLDTRTSKKLRKR